MLGNLALCVAHTPWLTLPAAALVYGFLPGVLVVGLVLGWRHPARWLEYLVLSAACSYALSSCLGLLVQFVPGLLTPAGLLIPLNVIFVALLLLAFMRNGTTAPQVTWRTVWASLWPLLVLVSVILFFRFASLGYSEYQGDEIDVTSLARQMIAGQGDAVFLHRKGPAELVIAASYALVSEDFNEFALRFPFALASGWAILGAYALGRRVLDERKGLLAAILLALNGIFLGFSRMVQYQGAVSLMLVSAVICYYWLNQDADARLEARLGVLGVALWGFGLLAHYEAALIGFVLALLYLEKNPLKRWQWDAVRPILIALGATTVLLLAYYLPFTIHAQFSDTFRRYTQIRIGLDRAPFNNLGDYLTSALFYNSVYYELAMVAGLLIAFWAGLRNVFAVSASGSNGHSSPFSERAHRSQRYGLWLVWLLLAIGLVVGAVAPAWLDAGGFRLPLLLVLPALILLTFSGHNPIGLRMCFLWFGVYLIAYAFLIRTPGLHYYTMLPAWALLAAWGMGWVADRVRPMPWRWLGALGAVALCALVMYYQYVLFIRSDPEYALTYPRYRYDLYWNTSSGQPDRFFGLPHRSGWKAAGYLSQQGALAGSYRSNEKEEIISWYMGRPPASDERPSFYLIADNATEKEHNQDYPKDLLASAYREVGGIRVRDNILLHIYQLLPAAKSLGTYDDGELAPLYDRITGLRPPQEQRP